MQAIGKFNFSEPKSTCSPVLGLPCKWSDLGHLQFCFDLSMEVVKNERSRLFIVK
jgi:hypothetical protein